MPFRIRRLLATPSGTGSNLNSVIVTCVTRYNDFMPSGSFLVLSDGRKMRDHRSCVAAQDFLARLRVN